MRAHAEPTSSAPSAAESDAAAERVEAVQAGWVEAAAQGDRRAFQRLYARYRTTVRAVALSLVGWPEADDVTQDVFLRAWERLPQLRDPRRFGPWLVRIARNRCTDHHRRPKAVDTPSEPIAPATPVAEAREVLEAIQSLSEAYRETLAMRLIEGMSGPEIAARTGLTPRSVRVNLHRGMAKLRVALGESPSPPRSRSRSQSRDERKEPKR